MEESATPAPCQAPIKLIMDDREPADVMLPALQSCGCFSVQILRLPLSDYIVNDVLLVERKTLTDLIQSIIDGRLFHQAKRLAEAGRAAVLILEGSFPDLHTEMRWEAIQGALVTVALFFGLPVLWTREPEDTARVLAYAARQQTERQRAGRTIDMRDMQIAGIVVARRAKLATRNVRHFADLSVDVINPWAAG